MVALLRELGEEGADLGELDREKVLDGWRKRGDGYVVLLARGQDGAPVGILTLSTAFAIYANGEYGVIDEMFVVPAHRSRGVGARLVEAAREIGKERGWTRIDVTAPESERWDRTRRFYERQGFTFTGPKLKLTL
ncbi:MAG: GNAT family N-acetyltransferase [Acidobacteriota bacterium]